MYYIFLLCTCHRSDSQPLASRTAERGNVDTAHMEGLPSEGGNRPEEAGCAEHQGCHSYTERGEQRFTLFTLKTPGVIIATEMAPCLLLIIEFYYTQRRIMESFMPIYSEDAWSYYCY